MPIQPVRSKVINIQHSCKTHMAPFAAHFLQSPNSSSHKNPFSFILETYIAPLQGTTTQRRSQPSHGQRRRTSESEKCKIWKGGPPEGKKAQRGDHSMLMDPQSKRPLGKGP